MNIKKETIKTLLIAFATLLTIPIIIIIFITISFIGSNDSRILDGYYNSKECWDTESFMDYLDYCEYYYKNSDAFVNSKDYFIVEEENIEGIKNRFANIEKWMEKSNESNEYSFDESVISEGDYFYLDNGGYNNYTIYFFDIDSNVLYYGHINT